MPKQSYLLDKNVYDSIWANYRPKNNQILENNFKNLKSQETSRYLSNFKFSEVFVMKLT